MTPKEDSIAERLEGPLPRVKTTPPHVKTTTTTTRTSQDPELAKLELEQDIKERERRDQQDNRERERRNILHHCLQAATILLASFCLYVQFAPADSYTNNQKELASDIVGMIVAAVLGLAYGKFSEK